MDEFAHSEKLDALAKALASGQSKARSASKNSKNPHFKSSYADLAEVSDVAKEFFAPLGISVSQWLIAGTENEVRLCTLVMHESGQWIRSVGSLPAVKRDPQAYGSAITYARRYALAAALGIAADDDDGNAASRVDDRPSQTRPANTTAPFSLDAVTGAKDLATLDRDATALAKAHPSRRDEVALAYAKRRAELVQQQGAA